MIHSPKFIARLDACVLYPAPIRDLLLHLASVGLYTPKWTYQIHGEWIRNLLLNRPDLTREQLERIPEAMNNSFPDATVEGYEDLTGSIVLPDEGDRHVVAAAVLCHADVIITANLKDFPSEYLRRFGMEAQHPDYFIANLIDLDPEKGLRAFRTQVSFLKNPPKSEAEVLGTLKKVGLETTSAKLHRLI
jgi:hypothetical protein